MGFLGASCAPFRKGKPSVHVRPQIQEAIRNNLCGSFDEIVCSVKRKCQQSVENGRQASPKRRGQSHEGCSYCFL